MRTYTPLSGELHQTGEATDVCIGADYPHLQPKHIEQEMNNGPLHVYRTVFDCGFVLRGVEPPAVPAAKPADGTAAAAEAVAAAVRVDPLPKATPEVEWEVPEAAPAAVEAILPPEAAQQESPQEEEAKAALAAADEDLPTVAVVEMELENP